MASHQGIDFSEIHARSGHSLGNNQERYLDQNILVLTFIGEYSLNGRLNETPTKLYPRFHFIGSNLTEEAHCLI